ASPHVGFFRGGTLGRWVQNGKLVLPIFFTFPTNLATLGYSCIMAASLLGQKLRERRQLFISRASERRRHANQGSCRSFHRDCGSPAAQLLRPASALRAAHHHRV